MSEPVDPFEDGEVEGIFRRFQADQIGGAVAGAQDEVDEAVRAVAALADRLRGLIPPVAVINLVSSMALGTALNEVYGDG